MVEQCSKPGLSSCLVSPAKAKNHAQQQLAPERGPTLATSATPMPGLASLMRCSTGRGRQGGAFRHDAQSRRVQTKHSAAEQHATRRNQQAEPQCSVCTCAPIHNPPAHRAVILRKIKEGGGGALGGVGVLGLARLARLLGALLGGCTREQQGGGWISWHKKQPRFAWQHMCRGQKPHIAVYSAAMQWPSGRGTHSLPWPSWACPPARSWPSWSP